MKIYAVDQNTDLDSFIGKELWVKCEITYSGKVGYFRILYASSNSYTASWIPESLMGRMAQYDDPESLRSFLQGVISIGKHQLKPILPLEVMTSEELCPGYTTNTILNKYVGKDIWVLCKLCEFGANGTYYIKVVSIRGSLVVFRKIDHEFIDEHFSLLDEDRELYERIIHSDTASHYIHKSSIDSITVVTPVDILTTDEMQESLDRCPRAFDGEDEWED